MANVNKKIISKGKATEEKEKKSSKSPVTVEVVDGGIRIPWRKGRTQYHRAQE